MQAFSAGQDLICYMHGLPACSACVFGCVCPCMRWAVTPGEVGTVLRIDQRVLCAYVRAVPGRVWSCWRRNLTSEPHGPVFSDLDLSSKAWCVRCRAGRGAGGGRGDGRLLRRVGGAAPLGICAGPHAATGATQRPGAGAAASAECVTWISQISIHGIFMSIARV